MKSKLLLVLIALTFNYGALLFATGGNIKIDDYSYKDGLTTSVVYNAYKDSKGFLWICSDNGLFRFDGYSFRNINTIVSDFLNQETYCIAEDPDNNFIIGTSNGIFYYNTHTERLFPLKLNLGNNCKIHQILFSNENVWFTTNGSGIFLFDAKSKNFTQNTDKTTNGLQLQNNDINLFYQDKKGYY